MSSLFRLGLVELPLHVVVDLVNLLQVLKEAFGNLQQHIENEAGALLGLGKPHQSVQKLLHSLQFQAEPKKQGNSFLSRIN